MFKDKKIFVLGLGKSGKSVAKLLAKDNHVLITDVKCDNLDSLIVTDNIKSIFIFPKENIVPSKCIKCGKCVDICPVGINPLAPKLDSSCIRCGLCNFVCPANINLISKEK